MKKFLIILFTLFSVFCFGQSQTRQTETLNKTVTHQEWTVENESNWGSFYWMVTRTKNADIQGRYWYYVYFYSNSYFSTQTNGSHDRAITYIKGITLGMDEGLEKNVTIDIAYATCDYSLDPNVYISWFYSQSDDCSFYISFEKVYPFDYSKY